MLDHSHTCSDYCQTYAPRIPQPPKRPQITMLDAHTERRIRLWLTWGAGDCGLIDDQVKDWLAQMYLSGRVTLIALRKLASEAVYKEVVLCINGILQGKQDRQPTDG